MALLINSRIPYVQNRSMSFPRNSGLLIDRFFTSGWSYYELCQTVLVKLKHFWILEVYLS